MHCFTSADRSVSAGDAMHASSFQQPERTEAAAETFKRRRKLENCGPKCSNFTSKNLNVGTASLAYSPDTTQNPKTALPSQQRFTQMHLDFGQRNFHSVQCPKCGLVYTPGKEADERLHANFHKKCSMPAHYQAEEADIVVASDGFEGEIVLIKECRSSKTIIEVAKMLEEELGLIPGWLLASSATGLLYVCRKTRMVLGCAMLEKSSKDKRIIALEPNPVVETTSKMAAIERKAEGREASRRGVGIRLVWTRKQSRRRGIATKLLDCARSQMIRGYVIPRKHLAFTPPTLDGSAFIRNYIKCAEVEIYDTDAPNGPPE